MKKLFKIGCGVIVVLFGLTLLSGVVSGLLGSDREQTPQSSSRPTLSPSSASQPGEAASDIAVLISVIDGDTIETDLGRVRIIGIDTPEREECGYEVASAAITQLISNGDLITLTLPTGQNDRDSYDRLLRYVETSTGVDIGLMQIQAGNAVARYDSRDGYPAHPKEAEYHAAQIAEIDANGDVAATSCGVAASTAPLPLAAPPSSAPVAEAPIADTWWTQYSSCSKLKKNTVGHPKGPFNLNDPAQVEIYNWFQYGTGYSGDGDGDGFACE